MLIQSATGNVGIGTTQPAQRLHVSNGASGGTPHADAELIVEDNASCYINLMAPAASERGIGFGSPTNAVHGGIYYSETAGLGLRTGGNNTHMLINSTGAVGIGTAGNSIDATLHVQSDAARVIKVDRYTSDGELLAWARDDAPVGSVSVAGGVVAYGAFTGVHYARLDASDVAHGTLVSMTGENSILGQRTQGETVYGVAPTTRANDPAVLGVYMGDLEGENYGHAHDLAQIAAVGNGDMWVVDTGAPIMPGDYLVASDVAGCGMKDDPSRFPIGHVVARAASRVDWSQIQPDQAGVRRARISVLFGNFVRGPVAGASSGHDAPSLAELADRIRQLEAMLNKR
jgi:hypothetical protein